MEDLNRFGNGDGENEDERPDGEDCELEMDESEFLRMLLEAAREENENCDYYMTADGLLRLEAVREAVMEAAGEVDEITEEFIPGLVRYRFSIYADVIDTFMLPVKKLCDLGVELVFLPDEEHGVCLQVDVPNLCERVEWSDGDGWVNPQPSDGREEAGA